MDSSVCTSGTPSTEIHKYICVTATVKPHSTETFPFKGQFPVTGHISHIFSFKETLIIRTLSNMVNGN